MENCFESILTITFDQNREYGTTITDMLKISCLNQSDLLHRGSPYKTRTIIPKVLVIKMHHHRRRRSNGTCFEYVLSVSAISAFSAAPCPRNEPTSRLILPSFLKFCLRSG